jgi:FAR1 DNA-binding domain
MMLFFYNKYAKRHGFGAVRRTNHNKDGVCYRYTFACNKHKKISENISKISNIPERNRPILATECKAKITIADPSFANIWIISKVNLEHNHELVPNTSHRITTHRDIPLRFQKELETNDVQGIPPSKNIQMVIEHAGGYGKCTFTKRDARNHIDKNRREKLSIIKGSDAQSLMEYFQKKELRDSNFYYAYSYTPEGRLENILWSDGRGRAAYKYFHDVIVLDSTYLKNR